MRIWMVTGVSTGLGRAIAQAALDAGDVVVGSLREPAAIAAFESMSPDGRAHGVLVDVRDEQGVRDVVDEVTRRFGPIDVLVNNAGYGLEGTLEEVSMPQARAQFDVNVFGTLHVIRAVLPGMRARRRGHILTVTSIGGHRAFPGLGIYNASKFALEGLSEALAHEVGGLGIRVTAVAPGSFRTDWAGRSMVHVEPTIADYEATVGAFRRSLAARDGHQPGDPARAAAAVLRVVDDPAPPTHLFLGEDAYTMAHAKLDALRGELAAWADVTRGTGFAPATSEPPQDDRERVRRSFAAWGAGAGSPFDLLADDATWTIVGNSAASRTYASREEFMREVIRPFNARMQGPLRPTIRGLYVDGPTVIVHFDAEGVARDGLPYRNTYTWYLEMRAGEVVRGTAFYDSVAFNDLWSRVAPAP